MPCSSHYTVLPILVDIQHTQCPCRFFLLDKHSSMTTTRTVRFSITKCNCAQHSSQIMLFYHLCTIPSASIPDRVTYLDNGMPIMLSFDMGEPLPCCSALSESVAGGESIICDILTLECPIMNPRVVACGAQARARSAWATSIRRTRNDGFALHFILLFSPCQGEGSREGPGVLTYACTPSGALSPGCSRSSVQSSDILVFNSSWQDYHQGTRGLGTCGSCVLA